MASKPHECGPQRVEAARLHRIAEPAAPEAGLLQEGVPRIGAGFRHALARPGQASPSSILSLGRAAGNRAVSRFIQARLVVGAAGDRYEQEADRVAEQVLSMPAPVTHSSAGVMGAVQRQGEEEEEVQTKPLAASITPLVQREGEEEEDLLQAESLQRQSEEDEEEPLQAKFLQREGEEEEDLLQAQPVQRQSEEDEEIRTKRTGRDLSGGFEAGRYIESRLAANRGGGRPLPADVRGYMEPRFGVDFSGVRLHTGDEATQLNRALQSRAFTHGSDVYLRRADDDVTTPSGRQLLAHELTHVVQQRGARMAPNRASRLPATPTAQVQRAANLAWLRRPNLASTRRILPTAASARRHAERTGRVGLALIAPTTALQDVNASSKGGKVGLGLAKAGAGVLEGVAKMLLGPLTYLRYFNANQRKALLEDTIKANYGEGKIATAAKTLATITKVVEEVGMVSGWIGLVAGLIGALLGAVSVGAGAAIGGTIATVCGFIALGCAGWSLIARSILTVGNIVRLGKYHGWRGKSIWLQVFKDAMGSLGAALGVITGGLGAGGISLGSLIPDANYGPHIGEVIAEAGFGQALSAPLDATSEGLGDTVEEYASDSGQSGGTQQTVTAPAQASSTNSGPSKFQRTMAALKQAARDTAALARARLQLVRRKKLDLAGVRAALNASLEKAKKWLGPIVRLGEQIKKVIQQVSALRAHSDTVDREENANPKTTASVEATAAKAEKAAKRDPKDIKPTEIQQIAAQVHQMAPAQKKSLFRRAGSALKKLFLSLMGRLSSAKAVVQRLMGQTWSKVSELGAKVQGTKGPAQAYLGGMMEADQNLPKEQQSLDEEEDASTKVGDLAEKLQGVTEG